MRLWVVYVLIAVVGGAWLGSLMFRDPGYVLLAWDGASVQMSLWVFLGLTAGLMVIGYYAVRLYKTVGSSGTLFQGWREKRRQDRSVNLTHKGLTLFLKGEVERSERFLRSGAETSDHPAVGYIFAARAAEAQNNGEARETYLRKASEYPELAAAAALASAEMGARRGDWQRVLKDLEMAGVSRNATLIRRDAYVATGNWQGLSDLIPDLTRLLPEEEVNRLRKQAALERLKLGDTSDETLSAMVRKLPERLRHDPEIVAAWCARVQDSSTREAALRAALKSAWRPELLALYSKPDKETLSRRLKQAESWQKSHPDDGNLQLCLGRLREENGDKAGALSAFQKSVDLGVDEARAELGRLFAFDGDYKRSSEMFSRAFHARGYQDLGA